MMRMAGYASKEELLVRFASGKNVLHVGAVGCTLQSVEEKIRAAPNSIHAVLSRVSNCVGVDIDAEGVAALAEAGIFDNIKVADVQTLSREEVPLPTIDVIVAGDVIEHLSSPGSMLDALCALGGPATMLVVTTPNAMGLPNFLRYATGRWREGPDHVCTFNVETLGNLLKRHAWRTKAVYTCYQPAAAKSNSALAFRFGVRFLRRYPIWGGTLFAIAHKET